MRALSKLSTVDVPVEQRAQVWREYLEEQLFLAEYRPLTAESILCEHVVADLDEGRVHSFVSNEHVVDLTTVAQHLPPKKLATPPLYFTTVVTGRAMYWSKHAMHIAEPGTTLVYDPREPFFISFHDRTSVLLTELDRSMLPAGVVWDQQRCARVDAGGLLPVDLISEVHHTLRGGSGSGHTVRSLGADMRRISKQCAGLASELASPGHFGSATSFIADRLTDPELSVERVAEAIHVSSRQLNRIFRTHGTSVGAYILRQRLHRAAELLTSTDLSVQEVAHACGFGSSSHFSRSFAAAYRCSPTALRSSGDANLLVRDQ